MPTFATTAEVQRKTGANANSTANTATYIDDFTEQAEALINSQTRTNWTDLYATLNNDVKYILKMAASSWAAMKVINYDMSGYTSRVEAETMLDVLRDEFVQCMKTLEDANVRQFIEDA